MAKRAVSRAELDKSLTPYHDALKRVLRSTKRLPANRVPVSRAVGSVAAKAVRAPRNIPGFANSAMDGFGVIASDLAGAQPDRPVVLRLTGQSLAGPATSRRLRHGECEIVATGAPLPKGADSVVPFEEAGSVHDGQVSFATAPKIGAHVRPPNDVVSKGTVILRAGQLIDPTSAGLLAQCGVTHVTVIPRPIVSVIATGDELVEPGTPLEAGRVYDANSTLLAASVAAWGAELGTLTRVEDKPRSLASALRRAAASSDLILVSGGASVGPHDWAKDVVSRIVVWRIAIKPGKPFAFAEFEGKPVLILPGNPGSAFVAFAAFGFDVMAKLSGRSAPPRVRMHLEGPVTPDAKRLALVPVVVRADVPPPEGAKGNAGAQQRCEMLLTAVAGQPRSSASLAHFAGTSGLALVPPGWSGEQPVEVLLFPWWRLT